MVVCSRLLFSVLLHVLDLVEPLNRRTITVFRGQPNSVPDEM